MEPKTWTLIVMASSLLSLCYLGAVQAQGFNRDWSSYNFITPSTPRPQDVNCHVVIRTTRQVGGRCVRMGQRMYNCQAGPYLAPNPSCERIMNQRTTPHP
ncbi:hypothetical protein ElyMa_003820600 [Elysia marginata]|uniref:EMI domain-containing protein n=1 Tax=Elysia marginata TaxID=1093978 RepID=A0AAV4FEQ8_9GAST|nr:hypothetical protein ElyMa_003820600 [Elysia marginata]